MKKTVKSNCTVSMKQTDQFQKLSKSYFSPEHSFFKPDLSSGFDSLTVGSRGKLNRTNFVLYKIDNRVLPSKCLIWGKITIKDLKIIFGLILKTCQNCIWLLPDSVAMVKAKSRLNIWLSGITVIHDIKRNDKRE